MLLHLPPSKPWSGYRYRLTCRGHWLYRCWIFGTGFLGFVGIASTINLYKSGNVWERLYSTGPSKLIGTYLDHPVQFYWNVFLEGFGAVVALTLCALFVIAYRWRMRTDRWRYYED